MSTNTYFTREKGILKPLERLDLDSMPYVNFGEIILNLKRELVKKVSIPKGVLQTK